MLNTHRNKKRQPAERPKWFRLRLLHPARGRARSSTLPWVKLGRSSEYMAFDCTRSHARSPTAVVESSMSVREQGLAVVLPLERIDHDLSQVGARACSITRARRFVSATGCAYPARAQHMCRRCAREPPDRTLGTSSGTDCTSPSPMAHSDACMHAKGALRGRASATEESVGCATVERAAGSVKP